MNDTKIYLITGLFEIYDSQGIPIGKKELLVSHGVGNNTLKNYVLSQEPPIYYDPKQDDNGLYIDI